MLLKALRIGGTVIDNKVSYVSARFWRYKFVYCVSQCFPPVLHVHSLKFFCIGEIAMINMNCMSQFGILSSTKPLRLTHEAVRVWWKPRLRTIGLSIAVVTPTIIDWEGGWVPHPKIGTQFGHHTHLKVLLEVAHSNLSIISLTLSKLDNLSWQEVGEWVPPGPPSSPMALSLNSKSWFTLLVYSIPCLRSFMCKDWFAVHNGFLLVFVLAEALSQHFLHLPSAK